MGEKALTEQVLSGLDARQANPMNDVLFKFIFGKEERKGITIDFLNAVLEESLEHPIKDIRFTQTEQVPQDDGGKLTRFDVACELDSGDKAQVKIWNQAVRDQDVAAMTNNDLLVVHAYTGTAEAGAFAERYPSSAVRPTGLGGSANVGMPIEVTFGGTRTTGTAAVSGKTVTFTEDAA